MRCSYWEACRALTGVVSCAAQKKTPETREQSKEFMLLLRELDPPVDRRSRWIRVRQPRSLPRSRVWVSTALLGRGRKPGLLHAAARCEILYGPKVTGRIVGVHAALVSEVAAVYLGPALQAHAPNFLGTPSGRIPTPCPAAAGAGAVQGRPPV